MAANFCSGCGSPLKSDSRFCPKCGTPVEVASPPTPATSKAPDHPPEVLPTPQLTPPPQGAGAEPPLPIADIERYLGGATSKWILLRGTTTGYGIHVTDRRLIGIQVAKQYVRWWPDDFSPKTVAWLDSQTKQFEAGREWISAIVMTREKKRVGTARSLSVGLSTGQSLNLVLGSEELFNRVRDLMTAFCPERLVVDGVPAVATSSTQPTGPAPSPASAPYPSQPTVRPAVISPSSMAPLTLPAAAQAAPPATPSCPSCGRPTSYIAQYGRYYCYPCARYL